MIPVKKKNTPTPRKTKPHCRFDQDMLKKLATPHEIRYKTEKYEESKARKASLSEEWCQKGCVSCTGRQLQVYDYIPIDKRHKQNVTLLLRYPALNRRWSLSYLNSRWHNQTTRNRLVINRYSLAFHEHFLYIIWAQHNNTSSSCMHVCLLHLNSIISITEYTPTYGSWLTYHFFFSFLQYF